VDIKNLKTNINTINNFKLNRTSSYYVKFALRMQKLIFLIFQTEIYYHTLFLITKILCNLKLWHRELIVGINNL
jgi:hypothetical protein